MGLVIDWVGFSIRPKSWFWVKYMERLRQGEIQKKVGVCIYLYRT